MFDSKNHLDAILCTELNTAIMEKQEFSFWELWILRWWRHFTWSLKFHWGATAVQTYPCAQHFLLAICRQFLVVELRLSGLPFRCISSFTDLCILACWSGLYSQGKVSKIFYFLVEGPIKTLLIWISRPETSPGRQLKMHGGIHEDTNYIGGILE